MTRSQRARERREARSAACRTSGARASSSASPVKDFEHGSTRNRGVKGRWGRTKTLPEQLREAVRRRHCACPSWPELATPPARALGGDRGLSQDLPMPRAAGREGVAGTVAGLTRKSQRSPICRDIVSDRRAAASPWTAARAGSLRQIRAGTSDNACPGAACAALRIGPAWRRPGWRHRTGPRRHRTAAGEWLVPSQRLT